MRTYKIQQSIRRFESFAKAAPYLDTLIGILGDFKIMVDYTNDLPVCVKNRFYYPEEKEG